MPFLQVAISIFIYKEELCDKICVTSDILRRIFLKSYICIYLLWKMKCLSDFTFQYLRACFQKIIFHFVRICLFCRKMCKAIFLKWKFYRKIKYQKKKKKWGEQQLDSQLLNFICFFKMNQFPFIAFIPLIHLIIFLF